MIPSGLQKSRQKASLNKDCLKMPQIASFRRLTGNGHESPKKALSAHTFFEAAIELKAITQHWDLVPLLPKPTNPSTSSKKP
ncbi:MAG: hypothetical protein KDM63_10925 [Verrucomicrobiae bacterium]|nr:hypothetical protein [Verrucomicrobiae bacterium]